MLQEKYKTMKITNEKLKKEKNNNKKKKDQRDACKDESKETFLNS